MADIELYQEDSLDDDNSGEMSLDDLDSPELNLDDLESQECGQCNPDDDLSAIQKLERYLNSENVYSRQMVARNLLETIRFGEPNAESATKVLEAMAQLAEDTDPMVRTELMEQLPHIAMFCHENASLFHEDKPISNYILPIIIKFLTYTNNQVRKTSQAALLVLLEQGLLEKGDVEKHVCPVIIDLAGADSPDDFRTEAVALMSKMAPLVGDDMTCRIFLPRFADMCTDTLFHVRKVCAANFGDLCSVVGQDSTETLLLSKFRFLCEDGVWGVRKACAECFTQVACACSTDVRHKELAQTFLSLICDQSRWVRMSAFQALGGFISTFADPSMTGLYFNEEGLLVVGKAHDCRSSDEDECDPPVYSDCHSCEDTPDPSCPTSETAQGTKDSSTEQGQEVKQEASNMDVSCESEDAAGDTNINSVGGYNNSIDVSVEENRAQYYKGLSEGEKSPDGGEAAAAASRGSDTVEVTQDRDNLPSNDGDAKEVCTVPKKEPTEEFNSFLYWRTPLPDVDVTIAASVVVSQGAAKSITALDDLHNQTAMKTQSEAAVGEGSNETDRELSENVASLDIGMTSGDATVSKDAAEPTGVVVHTASLITTEEEPTETVAHFGTTHVLGEHVGELAMKVIDGVVQDLSDANMTYSLVEDKLCARRDSSSREDDMSDEFHPDQDVIPQVLLDQYLSMTDPARAQTVDSEIAKHCAYSLPAVAYTLGRKYWPCLRELYETLAADMQWKVRRTLAFSIHELGMILGEEITTADLVPIFNGFLRDLDEVRVGVLKHLADFLKLLKPELRREYLTRLTDFLNTDNNRNWRFREDLAEQLGLLVELFSATDISLYMLPLVFTLAYDKVAQVRLKAFSAMSVVMGHLAADEDKELLQIYIADLIDKFACNKRWTHRQAFQHVCYCILDDESLGRDRLAEELLPAMLKMASDPIVNVRITLGKTLAHHVITSDYFMSADNPHLGDLLNAVQALRSDGDRDVCCFMHWAPESDHPGHLDTIPV